MDSKPEALWRPRGTGMCTMVAPVAGSGRGRGLWCGEFTGRTGNGAAESWLRRHDPESVTAAGGTRRSRPWEGRYLVLRPGPARFRRLARRARPWFEPVSEDAPALLDGRGARACGDRRLVVRRLGRAGGGDRRAEPVLARRCCARPTRACHPRRTSRSSGPRRTGCSPRQTAAAVDLNARTWLGPEASPQVREVVGQMQARAFELDVPAEASTRCRSRSASEGPHRPGDAGRRRRAADGTGSGSVSSARTWPSGCPGRSWSRSTGRGTCPRSSGPMRSAAAPGVPGAGAQTSPMLMSAISAIRVMAPRKRRPPMSFWVCSYGLSACR